MLIFEKRVQNCFYYWSIIIYLSFFVLLRNFTLVNILIRAQKIKVLRSDTN